MKEGIGPLQRLSRMPSIAAEDYSAGHKGVDNRVHIPQPRHIAFGWKARETVEPRVMQEIDDSETAAEQRRPQSGGPIIPHPTPRKGEGGGKGVRPGGNINK